MYLSDRDLEFAHRTGQLIVDPPPAEYDTTSIDLHLDGADKAKIWNVAAFEEQQRHAGHAPATVRVGRFDHETFARQFHLPVPEEVEGLEQLVCRAGGRVILRPGGFLVWQTKEVVGTPEEDPRLICFINGKSSIARMGLLVHMTAPTIHAGWWGNVVLEISNLGPFTLELREGDAIAQIVVAALSSPPKKRKRVKGVPIGQSEASGQRGPSRPLSGPGGQVSS
jgi:dCTP deaminase